MLVFFHIHHTTPSSKITTTMLVFSHTHQDPSQLKEKKEDLDVFSSGITSILAVGKDKIISELSGIKWELSGIRKREIYLANDGKNSKDQHARSRQRSAASQKKEQRCA